MEHEGNVAYILNYILKQMQLVKDSVWSNKCVTMHKFHNLQIDLKHI